MKTRILSLLCTITFILNFIVILPTHADEDFLSYFDNYDTSDTFVADALLGRVRNADGVPSAVLNMTNFGYTINQNEFAFETVGKDRAEDWATYMTPVFWSSLKNTLKFRIYDIPNWEDFVYEVLIIDFLSYNYNTEIENGCMFKDNMMELVGTLYDKACENGDNYLIEELAKINKDITDIQNDNTLDAALKASKLSDANLEKDKVTDYLKVTENGRVLLGIAGKAADVATSGVELLAAVNKIKTVKQVNDSRIRFLESMIDNAYGDEHFINAAKNVLSYYYVNNTDDYDMINRQYMSLIKPGLDFFSRNIITEVVGLVEAEVGSTIALDSLLALNLSTLAVDLLFNVTDKSQCELQLNLINIMHYYAVAAYRDELYTYTNNSTVENASNFIDAYKQLISFKCYANTVLKKYLNTCKSWDELVSLAHYGTNFSEIADSQIHVRALNYLKAVYNKYEIYYKYKINYTAKDYDEVIPVTSISLDTKSITLDMSLGQSVAVVNDLGLRIQPDNATNKLLHYHIHDADIVEIVKSGDWSYIFPIGTGSTIITFETYDGGYTVDLSVTVIKSENINNEFVCNISDYEYSINVDDYGNEFICIDSYYGENGQTKAEIPCEINGLPVKTIGENAFAYHTELIDVIIPDTVTTIESGAFMACDTLSNIRLSNNLETINDDAFMSCSSLQEINLPDSLQYIGKYSFYNCTNLKKINIPRNVYHIHDYTFYNCTSLESIVLPIEFGSLGEHAFDSCTNLKTVKFPDSISYIYNNCFEGCESLDNIVLNGVWYIKEDAFKNCKSLKNISILDSSVTMNFSKETLGSIGITTVNCKDNSTSLEYAKNLGYNYNIVPDKGDINLDGKVTVLDLVVLNKYLHNNYYFNYSQYDYADMNSDNNVNIYDYISLKNYLLKILSESQASSAPIYKTEYKKLLTSLSLAYNDYTDRNYALDYCLYDMDSDGVPELIVKKGTCEADYKINFYTFKDNKVQLIGADFSGFHNGFCFDIDSNRFCTLGGHMDNGFIAWYTINNGEVVIADSIDSIDVTKYADYDTAFSNYGTFINIDTMNTFWSSYDKSWNSYYFIGSKEYKSDITSMPDFSLIDKY